MDPSSGLISLGSLLRESWRSYARQFGDIIWISTLPFLVLAVGDYLNVLGGSSPQVFSGIVSLIGVILSILSGLALIYAAENSRQFSDSYAYAERSFFAYIWMALLSILVMIGGLIPLIVPTLIFMVWFSFSGYVFVIDGDRGLGALLKSKEYCHGYFWPVVLRFLIAFLIAMAVSVFAALLGSIWGQFGVIALNMIFQILSVPFLVIYELGIYHDLKRMHPEIVGASVQNNRLKFSLAAAWGVIAPALILVIFILVYGLSAVVHYIGG